MVGALVTVATDVVSVDTTTTVDFTFGVLTIAGLVVVDLYGSVTSMNFGVAARTVDVAVVDDFDVVASVDDVSVVLSMDDVVVATVLSSEMTTVSWKSNSNSGSIVDVAGAVDC